jgi:Fe-S cluster biogenesis protein NfuA/nitrite reductase/ring-hydroxylating ferredoxin subunit
MDLYGEGLERILAAVGSGATADSLADDPFVATLLLIHDLHPVPLEQRVQAALDSVRPYMESHGGDVALLDLSDEGIAHIHLQGSCSDCSASTVTLELAIKQALDEYAPDLAGLEVSGVAPQVTGLALPMAGTASPALGDRAGADLPGVALPAWVALPPGAEPAAGSLRGMSVAGRDLIVACVEGTLLAFRDACADCGGPLAAARLTAGALACPGCGRTYFLPRAGRSTDGDRLQLTPVPLLREGAEVKVAL